MTAPTPAPDPFPSALNRRLAAYQPANTRESLVFFNAYWQGLEAALAAVQRFGPEAITEFHQSVCRDIEAQLEQLYKDYPHAAG